MGHPVLGVTITCGLPYIFFDSKGECRSIFLNSIAEQDLNSILIGCAASRCRDRNCCTSSSVTYNIAVVITKVDSFAVPFGIDFKFSIS